MRRLRYLWAPAVILARPITKANTSLRVLIGVALACVSVQIFAVEVADDRGRSIVLDTPARRVVALAPHLTEVLFHIGSGGRLVGVMDHSDFPAAAQRLPRIGRHSRLNIEAILALKPDLIVGWQSGNPAGDIALLETLGLPVFVSEPRTLADIGTLMRRLGILVGKPELARQRADDFARGVKDLAVRYAGRSRLRVFYQVWDEPLYTLNREHIISELISDCGGVNIFADTAVLSPVVSLEAVIARDPEVIVGGTSADTLPGWVERWQDWPSVTAVRLGQVHVINADHIGRMGPRLLDGMRALCHAIDQARSAV